MALIKRKQRTRKQLIEFVNQSEFLSKEEKDEWLMLAEHLKQEEIDLTVNYFIQTHKEEEEFKLLQLFKNNLGDVYKAEITKISNKAKKEMTQEEEKYQQSQEEPLEDILDKLNKL